MVFLAVCSGEWCVSPKATDAMSFYCVLVCVSLAGGRMVTFIGLELCQSTSRKCRVGLFPFILLIIIWSLFGYCSGIRTCQTGLGSKTDFISSRQWFYLRPTIGALHCHRCVSKCFAEVRPCVYYVNYFVYYILIFWWVGMCFLWFS